MRVRIVARATPNSIARSDTLRRALCLSKVISLWSRSSMCQYASKIHHNDKQYGSDCQIILFTLPLFRGPIRAKEKFMKIKLIGAPVQEGAGRPGCDMGPAAFRAAGIVTAL